VKKEEEEVIRMHCRRRRIEGKKYKSFPSAPPTHTAARVRTLSSSATSKGWSLLRRLIRACSMMMMQGK